MEIYRQSKLYKLLKRIALMLCDGFRDLCESSTRQFVEMFYWQSLWKVDIMSNL